MFEKRKGKRAETGEQKQELAFLSCNIIIALCLLGVIGLSHVHASQQEEVLRRRAQVLVQSIDDFLIDEQQGE